MNGIKISSNGNITDKDPMGFAIDSEHPLWMCDLKANPKHYGLVRCRIASLSALTTRSVLSVSHTYTKTPSFIVQWNYPAGTNPSGSDNQTYGVGSLEFFAPGFKLVKFACKINDTRFTIDVTNNAGTSVTNLYAEFRYYIFAQPLSERLDG